MTEQDLDATKFELLADGMRMVATAVGFDDPVFFEFLEHAEYGIALDELNDHIRADGSMLSKNQAAILNHVARAMCEPGPTPGDAADAFHQAHLVGMHAMQEVLQTKRTTGMCNIERLRKVASFNHAIIAWKRSLRTSS